jgi:hypothetical protein
LIAKPCQPALAAGALHAALVDQEKQDAGFRVAPQPAFTKRQLTVKPESSGEVYGL